MELKYSNLDISNASFDDLKSALISDQKVYGSMVREIKNLEIVKPTKADNKEIRFSTSNVSLDDVLSDVNVYFEDEVNYYYSLVKDIKDINLVNTLINALPSRDNYHYKNILLRIYAILYREIWSINSLFDDSSITKEDVMSFSDDIKLIIDKIRVIQRLLNDDVVLNQNIEVKENKLILLPTLNGKIRIMEDFSNISVDYYDNFYKLLQSIKNGTFKNVKMITGDSNLSGLIEVKDYNTRVFYKRVGDDCYVIIGALIKKVDVDYRYRELVSEYKTLYQKQKSYILSKLNDPIFWAEQEHNTALLFDALKTKKNLVKVFK